jgi:hypothetical protein
MKWSRDHVLTCSYMKDLDYTVIDRLNVISSGSVQPCLLEVYPTTIAQMQKYVSKGTIWQQYLKFDPVKIW